VWYSQQKQNYKNNIKNMKIKEIKIKWEEFIEEYKKYLLSDEEIWYLKLEQVKNYINENKKIPSQTDKDKNIKILGVWYSQQKQNYKNNIKNMKIKEIKIKWEEFIEEYL
jgi:hypothetical protein